MHVVEKTSLADRSKRLLAEYGPVAIFVYLTIFVVTWAGFAIAIASGVGVEGVGEGVGTIGAAWVATKVTQPVRILATLLATPFLARLLRRKNRPS